MEKIKFEYLINKFLAYFIFILKFIDKGILLKIKIKSFIISLKSNFLLIFMYIYNKSLFYNNLFLLKLSLVNIIFFNI